MFTFEYVGWTLRYDGLGLEDDISLLLKVLKVDNVHNMMILWWSSYIVSQMVLREKQEGKIHSKQTFNTNTRTNAKTSTNTNTNTSAVWAERCCCHQPKIKAIPCWLKAFLGVLEVLLTDIPLDHLCCIYWDCQTAKRETTFLNGYVWELWLRNENWNTFVHHRHYYNISIWCLWCIWCIWCIWHIRCIWCIWCIWWIFQQYGWLVQWLMPD